MVVGDVTILDIMEGLGETLIGLVGEACEVLRLLENELRLG